MDTLSISCLCITQVVFVHHSHIQACKTHTVEEVAAIFMPQYTCENEVHVYGSWLCVCVCLLLVYLLPR